MNPIRIEVHNERRNGTFVFVTNDEDWQEAAREFIKSRAALLRDLARDPALKVWAVMFCGEQQRRIES